MRRSNRGRDSRLLPLQRQLKHSLQAEKLGSGIWTYETAAMELDDQRMFAWLESFGHENADFDGVRVDSLVGRAVDVEGVEAGFGSGVVVGSHDLNCSY